MIKGVIFDWARTTVDYGSQAPVMAFQAAFAKYGITLSTEVIRADIGMDKRTHASKILAVPEITTVWREHHPELAGTAAVDAIYATFKALIPHYLRQTAELKPGMSLLWEFLQEQKIQVGTTSGYTHEMLNEILPLLAPYAPQVNKTAEDTENVGRPQAAMLQAAMADLGLENPLEVLKVGDTINDILEGKNAGVLTVGILEGSNLLGYSMADYQVLDAIQQNDLKAKTRAQYLSAGADYVIDNAYDLIGLIRQLSHVTGQAAPILLTPGPLSTTATVKRSMLTDHGTWDPEYQALTQSVRAKLLRIAGASEEIYRTSSYAREWDLRR